MMKGGMYTAINKSSALVSAFLPFNFIGQLIWFLKEEATKFIELKCMKEQLSKNKKLPNTVILFLPKFASELIGTLTSMELGFFC